MKPLLFAVSFAACMACFAGLQAKEKEETTPTEEAKVAGAAAVQEEAALVAAAHQDALTDKDASLDAKLKGSANALLKSSDGVNTVRRAAWVCAWLRNDREFDRAKKLAQKTVKQSEGMAAETDNANRVERLYWEAWLRAEFLDDKATALKLVAEAEKLSPTDPRLADGKRNWTTGG
ncbi:MAG: hypothetical protein WC378_08760 [Opitutaceae bacterium]|jgi:hypothetical protein